MPTYDLTWEPMGELNWDGHSCKISAVLSAESAFARPYRHNSQMPEDRERLGRRNRAEMQE
jgi:hypothetical protein